MMVEWIKRYEGSPWHRVKLLIRGVTGLPVALYLTIGVLLYVILEIGNVAWDIMLKGDS